VPEYNSWRAFYLLEPWGWQDREYRTAAQMAMLFNVNKGKRVHAKKVKDFVRDMVAGITGAIKQRAEEKRYLAMSDDEKQAYIKDWFRYAGWDVK